MVRQLLRLDADFLDHFAVALGILLDARGKFRRGIPIVSAPPTTA